MIFYIIHGGSHKDKSIEDYTPSAFYVGAIYDYEAAFLAVTCFNHSMRSPIVFSFPRSLGS